MGAFVRIFTTNVEPFVYIRLDRLDGTWIPKTVDDGTFATKIKKRGAGFPAPTQSKT